MAWHERRATVARNRSAESPAGIFVIGRCGWRWGAGEARGLGGHAAGHSVTRSLSMLARQHQASLPGSARAALGTRDRPWESACRCRREPTLLAERLLQRKSQQSSLQASVWRSPPSVHFVAYTIALPPGLCTFGRGGRDFISLRRLQKHAGGEEHARRRTDRGR